MHARIGRFEGEPGLLDRAVEAVRGRIESQRDELALRRERG